VDDSDPLVRASDLRRGVTRLSRRLRLERPEQGEPLFRLTILGLLRSRGPMTPGDLASAERIQPQSLTRTLTALEAAGLINRQPDPDDGRRSLLTITEAGLQAIRHDIRQRDAWLAIAMNELLTPVEQDLLRLAAGLMERIAEADVAALHAPLDQPRNRTPKPPARQLTKQHPRAEGRAYREETTG
jgi:DNA-binding MarR family transcriptional regulator